MTVLLRVDASPRGEASASRRLLDGFVSAWAAAEAAPEVVVRDLARNPVPHLDGETLAALEEGDEGSPPPGLSLCRELWDEFVAADRIVFGVPMYNLSVPSGFKAYLDRLLPRGPLRARDDLGTCLQGTQVLVVSTSALSFEAGSPYAALDYQLPFLRDLLSVLGVEDLAFVRADGLGGDPDGAQESLERAAADLRHLLEDW